MKRQLCRLHLARATHRPIPCRHSSLAVAAATADLPTSQTANRNLSPSIVPPDLRYQNSLRLLRFIFHLTLNSTNYRNIKRLNLPINSPSWQYSRVNPLLPSIESLYRVTQVWKRNLIVGHGGTYRLQRPPRGQVWRGRDAVPSVDAQGERDGLILLCWRRSQTGCLGCRVEGPGSGCHQSLSDAYPGMGNELNLQGEMLLEPVRGTRSKSVERSRHGECN